MVAPSRFLRLELLAVRNRGRLDLKPKKVEFSLNPWRAPQRVLF
jgi:hypothetical protein